MLSLGHLGTRYNHFYPYVVLAPYSSFAWFSFSCAWRLIPFHTYDRPTRPTFPIYIFLHNSVLHNLTSYYYSTIWPFGPYTLYPAIRPFHPSALFHTSTVDFTSLHTHTGNIDFGQRTQLQHYV